jgi:hypothetical protein
MIAGNGGVDSSAMLACSRTGEYPVSPPAERGRCQQMSQQQTSSANKRQNLQSRPHAGEGG